jgi:fermentation-respiration switch protein FrsA (DUF1100 family)
VADLQTKGSSAREELRFLSAGETCAAWLYRPEGRGPYPIVVMAHGIGAIRQVRLPAYAERFVARGIAVLCFDYRGWGESEGNPRFVANIPGQHADIHAALDFAKSLPGIDGRRVALWGTSLGGGHAVAVAARREDLSAVVAQCAIVDAFAASVAASPPQLVRWLWAAAKDLTRAALGREPWYVPLASEPGTSGVMTRRNAEAQYRAMLMEPSRWENKLAARIFLTLPLYRPITRARNLRAPLLMIVTDHDEICAGELQARVAQRAARGEARHHAASHFEVYFGEHFERAVREMADFLAEQLRAEARP